MSTSNNGNDNKDNNDNSESWGSTFVKVASAAAAAATVAGGLIALLSSAASAVSSEQHVSLGAPRHNQTPLPVNNEKWERPEIDWVKMNVDGSREHNAPSAGCGGVLRDSSGEWLLGFAMKLDPNNCETHEIELKAILTGLELAREMKAKKLVLESDNESVVSIVNRRGNQYSELDVFERIRKLLLDPKWEVKLVWVPRTANRVADRLAKDARELSSFYNYLYKYYSPPANCVSLLLEDNAYAHGI